MKKLEGIERELNTFQHSLERLAKLSRDLVNRSHFDSENILRKQVQLKYIIIFYFIDLLLLFYVCFYIFIYVYAYNRLILKKYIQNCVH